MMLKVFDFVRSCIWYIVDFIYSLIDCLFEIIKKLNTIDIINAISDNNVFQNLYKGMFVIAITLFSLFIIWKFINKFINSDDEISVKKIVNESIVCGVMILLSTFLFSQVSLFSIKLSNFTANIFETSTKATMSSNMKTMFISYKDDYKNSSHFKEDKSIEELVKSGDFNKKELYLDKYVTKDKVIFADEKDYKYNINWILAIFCGGFFLYSLFFAGIMLGRRQIEFLFLFTISPIVFATSICNKQRRGAVIEQLVSLLLQSAVIMLIVNLSLMVMQQVNITTFFANSFQNIIIKVLLYIGCATFILTGSQTVNRFIGANVSAASGREQLMSLMGYGKMAGIGATVGTGAVVGGGLLASAGALKTGKTIKNHALTNVGGALSLYGMGNSTTGTQSRLQKTASSIGNKLFTSGQMGFQKSIRNSNKTDASDILFNMGASTLNSAVKTIMPRASYNAAYYRRKNRI